MDSAYYPSAPNPAPPKLVQVPKTALLAAATIVALSGIISILAAIKSCSKASAPAPIASASASASAPGSASATPPAPSETAAEAPPPPSATPAPEITTPFSVKAAKSALNTTGREVAKCRRTKLWGVGEATVTFATDGTVSHVVVGTPFRGTPSGECVSEVLSAVQVAPFGGRPASLNYRFFIPPK
jgi:hypothetical protein